MSDQHITCSECGGSFVFTESERQFYETKGLSGPPKRCKTCRQARKAAEGTRGGGGFGGGRDAGGPPRGPRGREFGGRGGDDRPRGGPPAPRGAPGGWGRVGGGDAPRAPRTFDGPRPGPGPQGRGPAGYARSPGPRPYAPRGDSPPRRFEGQGQGAPGAEPARPEWSRREVHDAPARDRFRPRSPAKPHADRPGHEAPRASAPAEAPRPAKKKAEKPKFDVTCVECGTAAQVPFKPIEGRDVFCQPCYRARRGLVVSTTAPTDETPVE